MRGKVQLFEKQQNRIGITPAYAGKSKFHGSCLCITWDHPRLCGEKFDERMNQRRFIGSPPPMRGKVADHRILCVVVGITPAYAGKSLASML